MFFLGWFAACLNKFKCGSNQRWNTDLCLDADRPAGDFAVLVVPRNIAALLNSSETRIGWRVIFKDIKRIFAGVESAFAGLYFSVMRECLSGFELIATTLHVLVESFEGCHDFNRSNNFRRFFLR
jgi:hypothetical protein